jgi:hypothetical protein
VSQFQRNVVTTVRRFDYEDMITPLATEANAIVPIVTREFQRNLKARLEKFASYHLFRAGLQTRASMVICTHFDQVRVFLIVAPVL